MQINLRTILTQNDECDILFKELVITNRNIAY